MEDPDLLENRLRSRGATLLNDCLAKAATGDFITLKGIAEIRHAGTVGNPDSPLRSKARKEIPSARPIWLI